MKALSLLLLCAALVARAEDPRIAEITAKRKAADEALRRELMAKLTVKPLPPMKPIKALEPTPPALVTTGTAQGIVAAGGRAQLFTPRDDTQDKLDAIQRQLDMQAEQAKLDAFRQHQIETAEKARRLLK